MNSKIQLLQGIIAGALLLSSSTLGQVAQEWVAKYSTRGDCRSNAIAVDGKGNVCVTGYCNGYFIEESRCDYGTVKYNSAGERQWALIYDGPGHEYDEAVAIALDSTGNVYVTGGSLNTNGAGGYATIKYSASGEQLWVARYDDQGGYTNRATALAVDGAGNSYVTGTCWGGSSTWYDYLTISYDSQGRERWKAWYHGKGNGDDAANALALDSLGNIYVTGRSLGAGDSFDYLTIKYDSAGRELWTARYNGKHNSFDGATSLAVDKNNNVFITGSETGSDSKSVVTIKYDTWGAEKWIAKYDNSSTDDMGFAICLNKSGDIFVAGYSQSSASTMSSLDFLTIDYNASGQQQWRDIYDGPDGGLDCLRSLTSDLAGNAYITGSSTINGRLMPTIIKYNANGKRQWVQTYEKPGEGFALYVDAAGDIFITGYGSREDSGHGPSEFVTIKYKQ